MNLADLHEIAKESDIEIYKMACDESGSISIIADTGDCYIAIDENLSDTQEEIVRTAHELGHCKTGAFYNRYSKFNLIGKLEHKANAWAIKRLLPFDDMIEACKQGYTEAWQLAEYFDLPQYFIEQAIEYYKNGH